MSRGFAVAAALTLVGITLVALAFVTGQITNESFLAAWLVCLALPLGALPLVIASELFGCGVPGVLRSVLWAMPVAAVLCTPVLLHHAALFGTSAWFTVRLVAMLVAWVALAVIFARRPHRARPGLALAGLAVHVVLGTVAGFDWVLAVDPGLASPAIGLVLITAQIGAAAALALVVSAGSPGVVALAMATLAAAAFIQFVQFLTVWSANLPREVVWYQHRVQGAGALAVWVACVGALTALVVMAAHRAGRARWALVAAGAVLLVIYGGVMVWLVTPGVRGAFIVTWADAAAIVAFAGLAACVVVPFRSTAHG